MKTQNDNTNNYILYGLLALMWSGSFISIKILVDTMPPIFCAMIRVLISLICLTIIFTLMGKKFSFRKSEGVWRIWLAGIFTQALPFSLLFYGEKFIAPSLASIINSTVSLWALLLGAFLYRDMTQWTALKIIGLLLGFLGIIIIFAPSISQSENNVIGIIAIMTMAISYAIGGLINQHVIFPKMNVTFEANLFQQQISSVLVLLLTSYSLESWSNLTALLTTHIIFAFLYLGLIATAIAMIIYFYLIKHWGAVRTTSVLYIIPALAILWDFLFLHITPSKTELVGAAAILTGVVLIQWKKKGNVTGQPLIASMKSAS